MSNIIKQTVICAALGFSTIYGTQALTTGNVAEAADYYVSSDDAGNAFWVDSDTIKHTNSWAECYVKFTNGRAGKFLSYTRYEFGVSNYYGGWAFKCPANGNKWESVKGRPNIQAILDFVMSH